jgi:hypothetical protein
MINAMTPSKATATQAMEVRIFFIAQHPTPSSRFAKFRSDF